MMIGSSIFQQWGIPSWKGIHVMNSAMGGTTADFWATSIREHLSYNTMNYAVYCGSNDLNQDMKATSITDNIITVLDAIKAMGQSYQAAYFAIMKAPQKKGKFSVIDQINRAVSQNDD